MPIVTAVDGAIWGYGRAGRAGGRPVLVHHGLIGDGQLGTDWIALGEDVGVEWIALERPGYGSTPPRPMASVSAWPAMVLPVLTALGIDERFDCVGISAGAPYAYALAAGMPQRVGRVAILSGVPFLHAPGVLGAYPDAARVAYARYRQADETELRRAFRTYCADMAAQMGGGVAFERALSALMAWDAAGPAREARLQAQDWGFGPVAVTSHVDLWHAEADPVVPVGAARRSAASLANASWHVQAQATHIASFATLAAMAHCLAHNA